MAWISTKHFYPSPARNKHLSGSAKTGATLSSLLLSIMKNIFLSIGLLAFTILVNAQQGIKVSGKILDQRSGNIAGAYAYLLNTNHDAYSDKQGNFTLAGVSPGSYTIVVSAIGFGTVTEDINVSKDTGAIIFRLTTQQDQLQPVIVTAQKKEELLQRLPLAVTAFNSEKVEDFRLWNSKDLSGIVPGLYASNPGDGRNVISIRGITSTSYDPAVTTYIDGVSQFNLDTYIPQLFDVERIEVLRGPQGTLYGRNAMGGIINVITKQPSNRTQGFVELNAGNYSSGRYVAGIRTPLVRNKLFLGVTGLYEHTDGFYKNAYTNSSFDKQHALGGNYSLHYLPAERWKIVLNVKHLANRNNGAFPLAGSLSDALADPFTVNQDAVTELVDNTFNASASIQYFARSVNITSQTAYQSNYRYYKTPIDADFGPIDGITIINNYGPVWNKVKALTQEIRFASVSPSRLKWTGGLFLFAQQSPTKQATHFGKDAAMVGSPDIDYAIINSSKIKNKGAAVYTQLSYALDKKWEISGGLRYDYQHTSANVLGEYLPDGAPDPVFETRSDTTATAHYNAISPKVSISLQPSKNNNLYLSFSRGYRTGGLTQLSSDPSQPPLYAYKPEYSNNVEFGSKNMLLNNRFRVNAAVFYTSVTNAQVPSLILPDAVTITRNAGQLKSKGIEAELAATLIKGLELMYNIGYTHAEYTTLKLSQGGAEVDLKGNKQIFTPDITSMLAAQYSLDLCKRAAIKLVVRGEWFYNGTTYFDFANNIRQAPYHLLNARLGITSRHLELMLWARNLADKKYIAYAYDFGAVHLGRPATYGVTVKAMF
jgi:iron complex outermembrane receptor protein